MAASSRNLEDYWEMDVEHSYMVTQVKGACSLIIASVEQYKKLAHTVERPPSSSKAADREQQTQPWWESIVGVFADDSTYDETMQLGRQYHTSDHEVSEELFEV